MRRFASLAAAAVLTLGLGLMAVADEVKKPEAPPPAKPNPNAQAINRLLAADELIDYGREHKSPIALITAAQLLHDTPTRPLRDMFKGDATAQEELDKHAVKDDKNGPEALLTEAKKMASDDTHLLALVTEVEKQLKETPKNLADGPFSGQFFMEPGEKALYPPAFRGGEWAEVTCRVIGGGQVTLKASDPKEGVDESDFGQVCHVRWYQRADGRVNIIRKNESGQPIKVYIYVP